MLEMSYIQSGLNPADYYSRIDPFRRNSLCYFMGCGPRGIWGSKWTQLRPHGLRFQRTAQSQGRSSSSFYPLFNTMFSRSESITLRPIHLRWYYSQCLRLPCFFADWTIASVPWIPKSHGYVYGPEIVATPCLVAHNQLDVQEKGFDRL